MFSNTLLTYSSCLVRHCQLTIHVQYDSFLLAGTVEVCRLAGYVWVKVRPRNMFQSEVVVGDENVADHVSLLDVVLAQNMKVLVPNNSWGRVACKIMWIITILQWNRPKLWELLSSYLLCCGHLPPTTLQDRCTVEPSRYGPANMSLTVPVSSNIWGFPGRTEKFHLSSD